MSTDARGHGTDGRKDQAMHDREPTIIKRLLDRLLAARARRDSEPRHSAAWQDADAEMHRIERAIFRLPLEGAPDDEPVAGGPGEPTPIRRPQPHDRRSYEVERAG